MRDMKLSAALQKMRDDAKTLSDELYEDFEGPRCLLLLHRSKDGGHQNKEDKRLVSFEIYRNKDDMTRSLERMMLQRLLADAPARIYMSVNKRSVQKTIHTIEQELLDQHYNNDDEAKLHTYYKLLRKPRHFLMQQKNRDGNSFMLDIDDEEGRDKQGEALTWCAEHDVEILHVRKSPNGWHIVTKPFNPNLFDASIGEVKKDALIYIA